MNTEKRIEALEKELQALKNELKKEQRPMDFMAFHEQRVKEGVSKYHEKIVTLGDLLEIRDEWNRIDEFEFGVDTNCFRIYNTEQNQLDISHSQTFPFAFKYENTARLFLDTFRPQLELIKELL